MLCIFGAHKIFNFVAVKIKNFHMPRKFFIFSRVFQVLSHDPDLLKVYFDKVEKIMVNDTLPPLTKEFIALGAAAAIGAENCLNTHVKVVSELGANDDEILLAILIGASISETAALSKSLRVYEEFKK